MDLQLNGRRVLVTGSSSGIGEAMARMLAQEGAVVVVHGRNRERAEKVAAEIKAAGVAIGDLGTDEGAAAVHAQALAALDSGVPVDVLHMPPEAGGVVGYNDALDGFNYRHFKVTATDALQRLAAYSRAQGPVPGLALQSASIADCLPGFLAGHAMPGLPPSAPPRLWVGGA